jgi:hypothetical protein
MLGVLALLAGGALDIPHLIEFASLDVILFLVMGAVSAALVDEVASILWLRPGRIAAAPVRRAEAGLAAWRPIEVDTMWAGR